MVYEAMYDIDGCAPRILSLARILARVRGADVLMSWGPVLLLFTSSFQSILMDSQIPLRCAQDWHLVCTPVVMKLLI
jgi:hypothetical protein